MPVPGYIPLSDLAALVGDTIDAAFGREGIWVLAEISNLKHYPARQHYYFDLIEKAAGQQAPLACMAACAWKQGAKAVAAFEELTGQPFAAGIQVLVRVAVTFHPAYGLKLVLQDLNPEFTIGNLHRQRQETLDRLLRECPEEVQLEDGAYITRNKRARLSPVIQSLAVISSSTAAGYEDFRRTLQGNAHGFTFTIHSYYAPVQGKDADKHLVDCLIDIYKSGHTYDAVILVRGGGSATDLLTYDSFRLARAVAKFPVPVITGIGHLRDVSIVDLMAHTHEITPTRAAEFIIGHNRRFAEELEALRQEIGYRSQQLLEEAREELAELHGTIAYGARDYLCSRREALVSSNHTVVRQSRVIQHRADRELVQLSARLAARPKALVEQRARELGSLSGYIMVFTEKYTVGRQRELDSMAALFRMLSPERTLQRGFAIISKKGNIQKRAAGIGAGDEVVIRMSDAVLSATITDKTEPHERADEL